MAKMSVVLERPIRISKYRNKGYSIRVQYSIGYRLSYVIIQLAICRTCDMERCRPDNLFLSAGLTIFLIIFFVYMLSK